MENVACYIEIDGTVEEHNPVSLSDSEIGNNDMKVEAELNVFVSDTDADNQNCDKTSLNLEEKDESKISGLFAPFNHRMKPDLEYIRLESKQSALNQEVTAKVINDRYKLIMENAAKHKVKEEKGKITFTQLSHSVDIEDIIKTTELLHNLHITSPSPTKDQLEELSDSCLEKIPWNDSLNGFLNLKDIEIDTKAMISNVDVHMSEYAVEVLMNEQKESGRCTTYTQMSQELDTQQCMKHIPATFDELEDSYSSSEDELY